MGLLLIAGLGNPGSAYAETRHNVGFLAVETLGARYQAAWKEATRCEAALAKVTIRGRDCLLCKPLTYMNASGQAVGALARFYRIAATEVWAVYDEIQLPLARLKLSQGGGDGGHNGAASLIQHVGPGFVRVRLGVGPKEPAQMDLKDFVLGKFTPEQWAVIEAERPKWADALELAIDKGVALAMNHLNRNEHERSRPETV